MTFLSLNVEKSSLTLEKNQLEYEEMILSGQYNDITEELSDYLSESGAEEDAYSKYLEQQQELYDQRRASIESQLKVINTEIDSYDKAVDTNIKQECKLSISV